ncbi:hypothetical protein P167DRAFT_540185 [Morchella conica CCBAS932]|uniref:Uncharacterized protein n=1 Tax=Morchella conica CCBAS932 TaxID=1392247 RepID=A0A3N4KDG2_9PEZI|nr:hypothetical protein P167DRAFT_540185 [Morchella conica CCBAS932]
MSGLGGDSPENRSRNPDAATLLSRIDSLKAELKAITTFNQYLIATLARLQAEQATPTPATTTITTTTTPTTPSAITAPLPCSHPNHACTIASGSGAASPEIFQEIIKTNWHGRLGRTHMVDVDALPATALSELDCLLRRKLHASYPRARDRLTPDVDTIFASLAALGLRLEDRGAYADLPAIHDLGTLRNTPTIKRVINSAAWWTTHEKYADYWQGLVLETLVELARYRGLFDDEGYLKE